MTVGTTEKYRFPYPEDNEPIRNLPDILQQQAEGIERVLAKFDYGGGDQNALTARVASLETLLSNIKSNYVTLYDNDNNVFQGAISLNESAANMLVVMAPPIVPATPTIATMIASLIQGSFSLFRTLG